MKITQRIQLIEDIARALQSRYTYSDINVFLGSLEVPELSNYTEYNSKRVYVKERLKSANVGLLKKIADELDISSANLIKSPPKNWTNTNSFRIFISHITKDKKIAKRLRDVLKTNNIDCFVAHEDIKPSEEWQAEIKNALNTMDAFISIHTKGFKNSIWCQQEIGFAVARDVKIIPIKFDEDPDGFIGRFQALIRGSKTAEEIAKDIIEIIKDDPLTKDIYKEKVFSDIDLDEEIPF